MFASRHIFPSSGPVGLSPWLGGTYFSAEDLLGVCWTLSLPHLLALVWYCGQWGCCSASPYCPGLVVHLPCRAPYPCCSLQPETEKRKFPPKKSVYLIYLLDDVPLFPISCRPVLKSINPMASVGLTLCTLSPLKLEGFSFTCSWSKYRWHHHHAPPQLLQAQT